MMGRISVTELAQAAVSEAEGVCEAFSGKDQMCIKAIKGRKEKPKGNLS